jgi:hypothetical protein
MGGLTRWLAADQALRVVASARRVLIQREASDFSGVFILDAYCFESTPWLGSNESVKKSGVGRFEVVWRDG